MRGAWAAVCMALVASLSVAGPASARSAEPVWSRTLGRGLSDVAVAPDGHLFVTGQIWAPPVGGDPTDRGAMLVAKLGSGGGLHWTRTWRIHGEGWGATGMSVAPAPGGGVFVGGISTWWEDEYPMLWRYTSDGRLMWWRRLTTTLDCGTITGVAADPNGVVVALTEHGNFDDIRHDGQLRAFSPTGRPMWRSGFEVPGITDTWDRIGGVAIGSRGRIYAAGHVDWRAFDSPDDPAPDEDPIVQALTRSGAVRWTRVVGDGPERDREDVSDVAVRGHFLVVSGSVDGWTRGWLGAYGTDGERLWTSVWGTGYETRAKAVAIAPRGPIYLIANRTRFGEDGEMTLASILQRLTRGGALEWSRFLGADALGSAVVADGGVYLTVGGRLERWPS